MIDINDIQKRKPDSVNWREWTRALLLLGMGVYLILLIVTGNLGNYINLRFQWLTYVAAGLFLMLGLWSAYRLFRGYSYTFRFDHSMVTWQTISIVTIPLVLALLVPSKPLSGEAISGGVSLKPVGGSVATYQKPPLERNILDWLREFNNYTETPAVLDNLDVDVIGFVYREPGMAEDQFLVARFTMSCCVADAFAIGMPVIYEGAGDLKDNTWVRIRGTLKAQPFMDYQNTGWTDDPSQAVSERLLPVIMPEQVEEVEPPDTPYLYS